MIGIVQRAKLALNYGQCVELGVVPMAKLASVRENDSKY